jgi:hypothetical protein
MRYDTDLNTVSSRQVFSGCRQQPHALEEKTNPKVIQIQLSIAKSQERGASVFVAPREL